MAVDELNCYMAVATTAVWQLPQTAICRSQLPKLPQQQLAVIPVMLRRPICLKFPHSNKKNMTLNYGVVLMYLRRFSKNRQ